MLTIDECLPQNEDERIRMITHPRYKRMRDYAEEVYPLDFLWVPSQNQEKILSYAYAIHDCIETNYITNKNNRDTLYLADEFAMEAATTYIDEQMADPLTYKKDYENESEEQRRVRLEEERHYEKLTELIEAYPDFDNVIMLSQSMVCENCRYYKNSICSLSNLEMDGSDRCIEWDFEKPVN